MATRERGDSVAPTAVEAAWRSFIDTFIVEPRRERAGLVLLDPTRRGASISKLRRWVEPTLAVDLPGNVDLPEYLAERLGGVSGLYLAEEDAYRVDIATAVTLAASAASDSIFLADDGLHALLFHEIGAPTLCTARGKVRTEPPENAADRKRLAERARWIAAAKVLGTDPTLLVACPCCLSTPLEVIDARPAPAEDLIERHLVCRGCGARSSVRMRWPVD